MHLVNLTTARSKKTLFFLFSTFSFFLTIAQDNSPYSRYGLGDVVPSQNIISRGMGGVSAGYSNFLNINFKNPAALGSISNTKNISNTIFDVGGEVDIRTLKSTSIASKYRSTNTIISYLQVAFPISTAKMERKGVNWGLSFGLRPLTRIGYKVEKNERLPGIDSLNTLYEGSGGVNQVNISTGLKIRNFSLGVSSGYSFGNKDFSTQKVFINDTVTYYKSNTQAQSHFGGVFVSAGLQYMIPVRKTGFLKIGAYADLKQNLKSKQDNVNETFVFDGNGGILALDTVNSSKNLKGTVTIPTTTGIGFTYQDSANHWLIGADFEMTNWKDYRYYGQQDQVQNNWTVRVGAEYYPAKTNTANNKYWSFVKYRAGFYFGPDYVKLDKTRNNYAATLGASFPLTTANLLRYGDFVLLNTAIEVGGRGNKSSAAFRETNLRFCIGVSMNARWFQKRSYQ